MSTQTTIAAELLAVWNSRDAERVAAIYTPDGVRHQYAHPSVRLQGRREIAEGVRAIFDAFPDSRLEGRAINGSGGGNVTVEWTWIGTQTGDLPGLPARGEVLHLDGVSVLALEGGLIREERVYWDNATHLAAQDLLS